ncbi:hypothetical protein [Kibdelosporangium phytohabitans]|nr:hypothetical protein [Kibdelosporangium phytohabitans]MBE1468058.1 hypothetical protein [Kibdelosporangium phytohabitans]
MTRRLSASELRAARQAARIAPDTYEDALRLLAAIVRSGRRRRAA